MAESVARQRINWRVLGVEAAAIFFSVLLGFGVTEWRESRQEAEQRTEAIDAFATEVERNHANLLLQAPYHDYLARSIREGLDDGSVSTIADIFSIPDVNTNGFRPVGLSTTAWKTATATGSLGRLDFATASALSDLYDEQAELLDEQQRIRAQALDALGTVDPQSARPFSVLIREFTTMERNYLTRLDVARQQLARATGAEPPSDTSPDTLTSYRSPSVARPDAQP